MLQPARFLLFALLILGPSIDLMAQDWSIDVSFSESVRKETFSGRVYLFSTAGNQPPRLGPNWFNPEPFVSKEVVDLAPGESTTISSDDVDLLSYPKGEKFNPQGRSIQAVMRFNPLEREVGQGVGNGFSPVLKFPAEAEFDKPLTLIIDQLVPPKKFVESDTLKLCRVRSDLMSDFADRDVFLNGAVMLPAEYYTEPARKFPVRYIIPGFGGTHHDHARYRRLYRNKSGDTPFIEVLLDPSCPEGHHVFADSAVNGPWGSAFVNEFLPEFERRFRTLAHREGRFLTGHSSGGWSSLWIMLNHPETFAGTWSTAPDPVTFADFQQIDLYRDGVNVYRDADNNARPLARLNGQVQLRFEPFDHMETVLGHGGQLQSFEAVFGPRDPNGKLIPAWSRESGEVDPAVIEHWKQYDIVKLVEANWETLQPLVAGRLHVHMGDEDTFYLDGACRILRTSLTELGEPDAVMMHPHRNHFNLLSPPLVQQIHDEMGSHVQNYFETDGQLKPQSE